jgi:hypothetical protein
MNDEQRGFVVSELVGRTILLQYVGAQVPDTEAINQMAEDPKVIFTAPTRVLSQFVRVESCDQAGIVVESLSEDPSLFFVSWGVISHIEAVNLEGQ